MKNIDEAIRSGSEAIHRELDRQEAIYARQLERRYSSSTPARSRFAVAAHITKTESKIARLRRALPLEELNRREQT